MNWLEERLNLDTPILDYPLFNLAGTPVTVATVVVFLMILLATFIISRLIQKALIRGLVARKVKDEGTIEVARRLLHYGVLATGLAIGLQTIGVNLAALFAAGAFFAVGLGFAMQNIMQNFVSGVLLFGERTIKPGDVIEFFVVESGGNKGFAIENGADTDSVKPGVGSEFVTTLVCIHRCIQIFIQFFAFFRDVFDLWPDRVNVLGHCVTTYQSHEGCCFQHVGQGLHGLIDRL